MRSEIFNHKRNRCYLIAFILGLLFIVNSAAVYSKPKPDSSFNIVLQNDFVHFEFDSLHAGLVNMTDRKSGFNHIRPVKNGHLLWSITFFHGIEQRTLTNSQFRCTKMNTQKMADGSVIATMEWSHLEWELENLNQNNTLNIPRSVSLGTVSVKVAVDLPASGGIATWRIWIDNNSDIWSLGEVEFPKVNGFLNAGKYDIARPGRPGLLLKECRDTINSIYRGNDMSMQFLCAMKGHSAVYMAAHDPQAWNKSFLLEPGGKFSVRTYAENMGVPGSDFKSPFPVMLGVYEGGWMEGCKIYRQFAVTAPWLSEGKLLYRSGMPKAIKEMGLWFEVGATSKWSVVPNWKDNPMMKAHIAAQKEFGVPIGVHWYNWHQIAWDNNYPHFIPALPGISEQAHYLESKGIIIMPYINGRIADSFNEDFPAYYPYSCKDQTGTFYIENYGPKKGRMVPMCPYTKFWQDKISSIASQISATLGVSAIYVDQVSASAPKLCFDKTHGHPLGGGHWWVDGNLEMLKQIRYLTRQKGKELIVTSETNAEQYIAGIDAFLQLPNDSRGIPMLEAVYSGYTLYFGTPASPDDNSDLAWKMYQGRSFIWGCQNGWMGFELLNPVYAKKRAFLKKIGEYRVAARKFLTYGELVDNISSIQTITERWNAGKLISQATLPAIQGAIWKAEDSSIGIVMVNYLDRSGEINYKLDLSKYGIASPSGQFIISQVLPNCKNIIGEFTSPTFSNTSLLGPNEIQVLELKAKPDN